MLEVYVLTFADEPFAQPLSAPISRAGVTIGRSSECVLHLPDPERHISRVQAKVESDDAGSLRVSNVSNANSIFVGDREIAPGEASTFAATDELRVGLFTLAVREASRPVADVFSVSLANAPLKRASLPSKAELAPLKVAEAIVNSAPVSQPFLAESANVNSNVSDPFLDLFPADAGSKIGLAPSLTPVAPAAQAVRQAPTAAPAKPSTTSMPTQIPDDFDPFAMPSAASRNTGDPFSALQDNKDVSLRGLLDDSSSAHRLIDETPMKGNAPDFDPILGAETTGGAAGEVLDPLALFGARTGATGFDDIVAAKPFGTLLDRPTSELNALTKFASPKGAPARTHTPPPASAQLDPLAAFGDHLDDPINRALPDPLSDAKPVAPAIPPAQTPKVDSPPLATLAASLEDTNQKKKAQPLAPQIELATTAPPPPVASATVIEKSKGSKPADNEHLLQALLEGIGIPSLELQGGLDEAMMRKIGEILRVSFDGTVEMMIARAMTKREVRTDVTMILAEKNNPIKFAPDGRAAIMQLLGKPFPGFMTHDDAIRDAYEDLRAHEVGVLAGMRAALKAVLNRFDPASLEKKITSRSSLETVLPHLRKAKLWDLYTEMSSQILAEAEDEFQSLFGKAFREVYEAEVEKVKQGRRKQ
jgi:FHA domain-containing protein